MKQHLMIVSFVLFTFVSTISAQNLADSVKINEVDYDQPGTDSTEYIEIIAPAGTDLSTFILGFFTASNGSQYRIVNLSGSVPDDEDGWGFWVVGSGGVTNVDQVEWTSNGIQNGEPGGIALFWDRSATIGDTLLLDAIVYEPAGANDGLSDLVNSVFGSLTNIFTTTDTTAYRKGDSGAPSLSVSRIHSFPSGQVLMQDLNFDSTSTITPGTKNFGQILDVITGIKLIENQPTPGNFALKQNYPNPFNPTTTMRFDIPATEQNLAKTRLTIYNSLGQKVKTLIIQNLTAGSYEIQWEGISENGTEVPAGIYFAVLKVRKFQKTIKMLFVK